MTTPNLNRIVTVTGATTITTAQPRAFPFSIYELPPGGNRWSTGTGLTTNPEALEFLPLPAMVSGFADIKWIGSALTIFNDDGTRTDFLPLDTQVTGRIYLFLPIDGALTIVASWNRTALSLVRGPSLVQEGWRWEVEDFQVFHDVPVVEAAVNLGYDEYTSQVMNQVGTQRTIWAEQRERGVTTGILRIGDSLGTGTEESAAFITRYDVALAVPISITDDLGRIWTVGSARSILDRRYLEYETFRILTVLDAR